jgi:hypothetical protein
MNKMKIGSAVALPGKRGNGYLEIASYLDGTPVKTPVMILNGSKPGPRLWDVFMATSTADLWRF